MNSFSVAGSCENEKTFKQGWNGVVIPTDIIKPCGGGFSLGLTTFESYLKRILVEIDDVSPLTPSRNI